MKEDKGSEKEFYRLWYEYLKRSDNYKDFCKWVSKKRKNKKFPVPEKFKKSANGSSPKELFTYLRFRDIYTNSFETLWRFLEKNLKHIETNSSPKGVENYNEFVGGHIDSCIESFKRHNKRLPNLQEFRDAFLKMINEGWLRSFLFLMVNVSVRTDDDLIRQFKNIIKEKRKDPHVKMYDLACRRNLKPSPDDKHIPIKELRTYLKVYDLAKKHGYDPTQRNTAKKIYEIIDEQRGKLPESTERKYRMYLSKAKRIIENTEHGFFPGKY